VNINGWIIDVSDQPGGLYTVTRVWEHLYIPRVGQRVNGQTRYSGKFMENGTSLESVKVCAAPGLYMDWLLIILDPTKSSFIN
jgi:hypothetical protein